MAEVRGDATGSKACDLASPQLQETPEIVGVASNTELRFRSDPKLASLKVVAFSVIQGRAVCVERRTYGSWGGAHREVGPYPPRRRIELPAPIIAIARSGALFIPAT
jgi:hypothetical protein